MSSRRFFLFYVLPTLLLLVGATLPLIAGTHTLFRRDVFNVHLPMKWVQQRAMEQGYLPVVDSYRSSGQPHLGNPNTVPLYPTNLLYLVADVFWALNAHFWIHLLLAPFTVFWLARVWGLARAPAWAAGVCYAGSGFFLSTLNLYNMVAGITLAPALVAALLTLSESERKGRWVAGSAVVWCLLLLAGDPMTAAAAAFLALSALVFRYGLRGPRWLASSVALGLGTVLAAPQLVEFVRILPLSFRGYWGYSSTGAMAASWPPLSAAEWLLPFLFGLPDLTFWGTEVFSGEQPFFYTLYPGLLALLLVILSGRPHGGTARWAWTMVAVGLFVTMGRYNPLISWLAETEVAKLLRLPVKLWILVAMGGALLCGLGFERLLARDRERLFWRLLISFGLLFLLGWLILTIAPGGIQDRVARLLPDGFPSEFARFETVRWAGLCLVSLLLLASFGLLWRFGSKRPKTAGGALLALHLAAQLFLLRPVFPMDQTEVYREPAPLLEAIPKEALVAHGKANSLFGPVAVPVNEYPDRRLHWLQRQVFQELYPAAGITWGRRYEFTTSPEGLDSFLSRITTQAFRRLNDAERIRLLAASGVEVLLLGRELEADAQELVEPVARFPSVGGEILVYRVLNAARPVELVGTILRAPHLNAALTLLTEPPFDPRQGVVLPGEQAPTSGPGGAAKVVASGPESLIVRVHAEGNSALVVQRAYLPLYRASLDGSPASIQVANMHRMAVEVPAGEHEVRIWIDRRPLVFSATLSLLALGVLIWSWLRWKPAPASQTPFRPEPAAPIESSE